MTPAAGPSDDPDEALRAIAHPSRRTMLRLVWNHERPASELADAAGLTRPAASQHLKQLRQAGLVTVRVDANQWMAQEATLDARPGGAVRWTHANGDTCSGTYVELVPGRRVVFTYGWERQEVEIPPGSTTVEIDLTPMVDGGTLLKLVHRGLTAPAADAHDGGWRHYLDRLRRLATGEPPGPDPFASRRVPIPGEPVRQ